MHACMHASIHRSMLNWGGDMFSSGGGVRVAWRPGVLASNLQFSPLHIRKGGGCWLLLHSQAIMPPWETRNVGTR
jgi:hypothetical protein